MPKRPARRFHPKLASALCTAPITHWRSPTDRSKSTASFKMA
ncbi:hypothetical protein [Lysobacter gummosus]